jgi:DNA helicase-2/ATP-dependent DNA helicase PcrA
LLSPGKGGGLAPRNIDAFTFTDKAAAELKERIVTRTRQALGDIPGMAEMFVGTIHAFCLELLKSESPKHLKFEVLNEVQQGLLVDRNSSKSGLTTSTDLTGAALSAIGTHRIIVTALSILRSRTRRRPTRRLLPLNGLGLPKPARREELSGLLIDPHEAVTLLTNDDGVRARLAERVIRHRG